MSFEFIKMLLLVTVANFVVVFGGVFTVLFVRGKLQEKRAQEEGEQK